MSYKFFFKIYLKKRVVIKRKISKFRKIREWVQKYAWLDFRLCSMLTCEKNWRSKRDSCCIGISLGESNAAQVLDFVSRGLKPRGERRVGEKWDESGKFLVWKTRSLLMMLNGHILREYVWSQFNIIYYCTVYTVLCKNMDVHVFLKGILDL